MKANHNKNKKIFRLNNGTIQVYNFEPKYANIALFRLQEMKKIPEEEQVLRRDCSNFWFIPKKKILYECEDYIIRKVPPKNFDEMEDNYQFVRKYIKGILTNASVNVIKRNDKEENLFIINPNEGTHRKKIQITPDLYLEYLLENERFAAKALQEEDLTIQQPLFNISDEPIMECNLEALETLLKSGIISGNLDDRLELLEGSTKVYEKLKKQ